MIADLCHNPASPRTYKSPQLVAVCMAKRALQSAALRDTNKQKPLDLSQDNRPQLLHRLRQHLCFYPHKPQ
jgi:hypothetical protein